MSVRGFFGKLLSVDLSSGSWFTEPLESRVFENYLGGKGLATYLLLKRNPEGVDPLSPDNLIIIALGPFSDSPLQGSCRHGIFSKSPLTRFYAESYSGGRAADVISRAGFDALCISGASNNPVWLWITDEGVRFNDATDLWGLDTFETERRIKEIIGDDAAVLSIGPAGENLVLFAVVENDRWRSAGRTGMGALLGSKKIKALAFSGKRRRPFYDYDGLAEYAKKSIKDWKDHPAAQAYRNYGTPMMVALLNSVNGFPTRYWRKGFFDRWQHISAELLKDHLGARPRACRKCFMACGKFLEIKEGPYKGLVIEGPEYETIYAFGGLCEIDRLDAIAYLNDLCDRLGMDTITAGNLAAFAVEASYRGKLPFRITYGDVEGIANLLRDVAYRRGVGEVLADGIRRAAREWDMEDLAVHVKGLEPAGYDPRVLKGMGLAYAVSDRGACHLRSTFYKAELAGLIPPDQIEGKVEMFLDFEDRCTLHDCGILCRFYRDFYLWDELAEIYGMATGLHFDRARLRKIASSVVDNTRRFNLREGLTAEDDSLPKRFFTEPLENGALITEGEFMRLRDDYYKARGWSKEGIPTSRDPLLD
ncbi:aldehyde ferredoxin oxidoreductase family protein [Thermodesulforhabdus norvegica]|uniref:Aldehyde:ferredoxin oxidoreductase n=1 Tax=Thermodesulforhabdus norvegica TaxID=39841 RepID=A0A1I4TP90_9BACT|nr:aldehyde ferredoxin oxidoreductase family protein [Thermodesulforhabdus norvegica]SFM78421.1 aldehyde:ferredoxin oxidoreductase [Thermodesulforhabdus norvegica]